MNRKRLFIYATWLLLLAACGQGSHKEHPADSAGLADTSALAKADSVAGKLVQHAAKDTLPKDTAAAKADEKQFDSFFEKFQQAVRRNDEATLKGMLQFPFQTAPQWTSEDYRDKAVDKVGARVDSSEFHQYYNAIFSGDVKRLLPRMKSEDVTELEDVANNDYYATMQRLTDKGTPMYEAYSQFAQQRNPQQELFFGFVFGKVNGTYKAVSFYSRWPAKTADDK